MCRIKSALYLVLLMITMNVFMTSCDDENERELFFTGDSLVARWDLSYYFPTIITHNDGVSGSGIDHLQESAGLYKDKEVVIIVGTNDLYTYTIEQDSEYVNSYLQAIIGLGASRVYLFSIFPRGKDFCYGPEVDNEKIKRINKQIKQAVQGKHIVYIDVYDLLEKDGYINGQYTYDGLHMSQEGYELITKQLKEVL